MGGNVRGPPPPRKPTAPHPRKSTGFRRHPLDSLADQSPDKPYSGKQLKEAELRWADATITTENMQQFLAEQAVEWAGWSHVHTRLESYGVGRAEILPLLAAFTKALQESPVFQDLHYTPDDIDRTVYDLTTDKSARALDTTLTRLLYAWASHSTSQPILSSIISIASLTRISSLYEAASLASPAAAFDLVRAMPKRKFIMHVGPTNSGKTHNALRALAAAPRGIYAGPLRLLAHEIFERLNKGQIIPLGQDPDADPDPDEETSLDVVSEDGAPVVQKSASSKYARPCNLITGEEQRIIAEDAGLVSCTVEMIMSSSLPWDVAVVDEIQMIADPDRGGAWSSAILGLNAKEIHLCGEETAVPLIRQIVESTGDELVVNTYQRLTPLRVADESLGGNHALVQKGDCVVCFSRSTIFQTRDLIQQKTGMKCALAYGRLPPELRTKQAALFNDPDSDYDVIVGSDAIGMGLNLKIKRIVFNVVQKWNGGRLESLSLSQFKQISGRAGRFGLHGEDESGGVVTTLRQQDLEILREALSMAPEPLKFARIHPNAEQLEAVAQALPPDTPLSAVQLAFEYVSRMHPSFALVAMREKLLALDYMSKVAGRLTMADRFTLQLSPIAWRDGPHVEAVGHLMRMYQRDLVVDYRALLELTGMQSTLDSVRQLMMKQEEFAPVGALEQLESIHKFLILYLWLSYRFPVSFAERAEVTVVKEETEEMMQWCLQRKQGLKPLKQSSDAPSWTWKQKPRPKDKPRSKSSGAKDLRASSTAEIPDNEAFRGSRTKRESWRRDGAQKLWK